MTFEADNPYAAPQPADENCEAWDARSGSTEYGCRKVIRCMQYVTPMIVGTGVVAVLVVEKSLVFQASVSRVLSDPILYLGFAGALLLLLAGGAAMWWVYYHFAGVTVALEENALVYRTRSDEKRLPFDDQMLIDTPHHLTYASGCLRIRSGDESIRVMFSLEGVGHLVRLLKAALDVRGLTQGYDRDRLFAFLKTAEFSDQSAQRFEAAFWKLVVFSVVGGALGGLLAALRNSDLITTLIWVAASAIWPLITYWGAEAVFLRRFSQGVDKDAFACPPRDPLWERKILRKTIATGVVVYAAVAVTLQFA